MIVRSATSSAYYVGGVKEPCEFIVCIAIRVPLFFVIVRSVTSSVHHEGRVKQSREFVICIVILLYVLLYVYHCYLSLLGVRRVQYAVGGVKQPREFIVCIAIRVPLLFVIVRSVTSSVHHEG